MVRLQYDQLVAELFPRLSGGVRWGLERTRRLLAGVGDPHLHYATLHIGGTNGKGSVAATVAAVLGAAGHRVGLYTSPHLCDFRERFRVAGEPLGADAVTAAAERVWPGIEQEQPSFFEATTAIGFLALADAAVDIAVIEVGLGGRLDATNVVAPVGCVITNVALDHMQYLGSTLDAIAAEKAGILKRGIPAVTGETDPGALGVLRRRAAQVGAPLSELDPAALDAVAIDSRGTSFEQRTATWGRLRLHTPLIGAHQAVNAALAVALLEQLPPPWRPAAAALRAGMAAVCWPGRCQLEEIAGRRWIFDVAHNVAGMHALCAALDALQPARPLCAVVGVLGDKDWQGMLEPLRSSVDRLVLTTPPSAPADRCWDPVAVAAGLGGDITAEPDFDAALRATAAARTVLVAGSFHTVGDALRALGRAP